VDFRRTLGAVLSGDFGRDEVDEVFERFDTVRPRPRAHAPAATASQCPYPSGPSSATAARAAALAARTPRRRSNAHTAASQVRRSPRLPRRHPCVTTQERLGKIDYAEFNRLIRKAQQRVETCRRPCLRTAPRLSPWTS
jgi:hypothetical protein